MPIAVQDVIERELVIPVPRQRVWNAITQPDQISRWFCDSITMTLEPGSDMLLHWEEHGTHPGRVEAIEPFDRFAFWWTPSGVDRLAADQTEPLMTLVEFFLDDVADGTRVTVRESGFASLPDDVRDHLVEQHTGGWIHETGELVDYLLAEHAAR